MTITITTCKLHPPPRQRERTVSAHEVFVPGIHALVNPSRHDPQGKWSLVAAHPLVDGKNGQLMTFELEADAARFVAD